MSWKTQSMSPDSTEMIAAHIGKQLKGGEVIELVSDLGGGKTTFVRGLARGMGINEGVSSPSYTISKVYKASKLELHHFDFYRLQEAGVMAHELYDLLGDPAVVVVIEWADVVYHVLPAEHIKVNIRPIGNESRELIFNYPQNLKYVMVGLC